MFFRNLIKKVGSMLKKSLSQMSLTKVILLCLLLALVGAYLYHTSIVSNLETELRDTRNSLSEAIGSIEIAEGVQSRMGVEIRNLNNRVDDLLGENSRLEGVIGSRDTQIRALSQVNATLTESLRFSSRNPNSNATVSVISGCDDVSDTVGSDTNVDNTTTRSIPNIRTDFSLIQLGFEARGFTTTNPALAELSLIQIDPFVIDIAITEDRDNTRSIVLSEQQNRLTLDVGTFSYTTRLDRIRWYELLSVGGTLVYTGDQFMLGPTINIATRRRAVASGGPLFSLSGDVGGHMTVTIRPFYRNRR